MNDEINNFQIKINDFEQKLQSLTKSTISEVINEFLKINKKIKIKLGWTWRSLARNFKSIMCRTKKLCTHSKHRRNMYFIK